MIFKIEGILKMGRNERTFSKSVEARSENDALNKVFAEFGSKNGLTRNKIKVKSVQKVG